MNARVSRLQSLHETARFNLEKDFNQPLLEVFIGDRKGSRQENKKIKELKTQWGDSLYQESVFLLTQKKFEDASYARRVFQEILKHRVNLSRDLKRYVSIQVASLDYMQNILNLLRKPIILEEQKNLAFARELIQDKLSHALKRDQLDWDLKVEIERHRRYGIPFSIISADIDNLKHINDQYGHIRGDEVIKAIGTFLSDTIRIIDSVYRYGGDEMVILLPGMTKDMTRAAAVRLKRGLGQIKIPGFKKAVTLSMGITSFGEGNIQDAESLMRSADQALYRAKSNGKNRICVFGRQDDTHLQEEKRLKHEKKQGVHHRRIVNGVPVIPGLATGHIYHYRDSVSREMEVRTIEEGEIDIELNRISSAMEEARIDLSQLKDNGDTTLADDRVGVFEVQNLILSDKGIWEDIVKETRKRMVNGEEVIRSIFLRWEKKFSESESLTVREKTGDILDVAKRIINNLKNEEGNELASVPKDTVIFAKRLLPSDTVHLNVGRVKALVTQEGGASSHAAILADSMGLPMISGIDFDQGSLVSGMQVLVNGDQGKLTLNPTREEVLIFKQEAQKKRKLFHNQVRSLRRKKIQYRETPIRILANAASENDILLAQRYGCDGIGLFRTERVFMATHVMPSRDQLLKIFLNTLQKMKGLPVCMRLLDLGGDKMLPYFHMDKMESSVLGLRGIRLLMKFPELLEAQLSLGLRLSATYQISLMVPMVTLPEEMILVRKVFNKVKKDLIKRSIPFDKNVLLGVMIETPSSVLAIDAILKYADFISIGTNDLLQYTIAADREQFSLREYYRKGRYLILDWIRDMVAKAEAAGKPCRLCGELGSDLDMTEALLKTGLKEFSVTPNAIPALKAKILSLN